MNVKTRSLSVLEQGWQTRASISQRSTNPSRSRCQPSKDKARGNVPPAPKRCLGHAPKAMPNGPKPRRSASVVYLLAAGLLRTTDNSTSGSRPAPRPNSKAADSKGSLDRVPARRSWHSCLHSSALNLAACSGAPAHPDSFPQTPPSVNPADITPPCILRAEARTPAPTRRRAWSLEPVKASGLNRDSKIVLYGSSAILPFPSLTVVPMPTALSSIPLLASATRLS